MFLLKYILANATVTSLSKKDLEELRQARVGEPVLAPVAKVRLPPPAPGAGRFL